MIVEQEVTNQVVDMGLLQATAEPARAILEVETIDVVADAGYFRTEDIEACEKAGLTPRVPRPQRGSSSASQGFFRKDEFRYDAERDAYVCPAGQVLATRYESKLRDMKKVDYANRAACPVCPLRSRCTNDFRKVSQLPFATGVAQGATQRLSAVRRVEMWRGDVRLARSIGDLQDIVRTLKAKGATLRATEQPIDTSTAVGKAFLDMLGVFAEFETNLRRERQLEGVAAAKERGVYKGRPATIDAQTVAKLKSEGLGATEIARRLKIGRASVYRVAAEAR